ncbi:precorrin-6A synthase (deacetylating) [Nocardiopsis salina]|uniref:precorrin-6A synthase (deacetylating) n=1 Tax=Nocardiopsis salina TaxID=245836 RepID=UPI0003470118|nr:precorrin-6A synthase (deacetylating) [Nocardiopsis salina]
MRVRIVGIGMGPDQLTPEAAAALRGCDYAVAARKRRDDGLFDLRRAVCDAHGLPLVGVPDPERDRDDPADYRAAVADWHEARVRAFEQVLAERGGTAAFLVWGDPSLYDSTLRIVARIAERAEVPLDYDVLPGISAPQLLAARHRIVLHGVGRPVHVTPLRRLDEAVAAGHDDIVVMLGARAEFEGLEAWSIWWGANLGTGTEELVSGRVGDVRTEIGAARARAKESAGWVMDTALLRRPS